MQPLRCGTAKPCAALSEKLFTQLWCSCLALPKTPKQDSRCSAHHLGDTAVMVGEGRAKVTY